MQTNGPFGKREEVTEYAVINSAGDILSRPFPNKERAYQDLLEWQEWNPNGEYHIVHRGVRRDPFYLTTNSLIH